MTDNIFDQPTYVVLEVPDPPASAVTELRRRYDPERAGLEVEISLSGSSGTGSIAPGQNPDVVFNLLDRMASKTAPFFTSFNQIKCFCNTGIFYFTMNNPDKFIALHRHLVASGIVFTPNPWPYEPHCTITLCRMPINKSEQLLRLPPPTDNFIIDSLAVYQLPENGNPHLLHRCRFGGYLESAIKD